MELKIYQVDAFTNKLFGGNPAAICPLNEWLPDSVMQNIAAENNLAETAYFIPKGDEFELRWFTPKKEVDLCGHATLATSYVIFEIEKSKQPILKFHTRSGVLSVSRASKGYTMNFPADVFNKTVITDEIINAIGTKPIDAYHGKNILMVVMNSEKEVLETTPNFEKVKNIHEHGLIVTAKGDKTDFVSRSFFPNLGINEDPVTGASHTILTPFWADRLNKNDLTAKQLSERGGDVICKLINNRVELSGEAVLYLEGRIFISQLAN